MHQCTKQTGMSINMMLIITISMCSALTSCGLYDGTAFDHNSQGVEYYYKGDLDKAISEYTEAISLNPLMPEPYSNRCLVYSDKYEHEMALKDCNKAIALKPDYAVAYNNRACVYLHLGENGLAEHDLSQAIKLDPEYISAYTNRSALYNATGRYEMAIQDATRVIQTQPQNHVAFNNRGFAHYSLNEFDAAEHDLQEAIRLKPDYPKPYYILGLISEDRGDAEDATRLFRKALDLTNDPDLRQRIENELQFIEGS